MVHSSKRTEMAVATESDVTIEAPPPGRVRGDGLAGVAAAALSLAAGEAIAGASPTVPSLVESVGGWVIDSVPPWVKDFAIRTFGIYDKLALVVGIVVVALLLGYIVGRLARRRFSAAVAAFVVFGGVGAAAAAREPGVSIGQALLAGAVTALLGIIALRWLLRRNPPSTVEPSSRRAFLIGLGAVGGLAIAAAGGGRWLISRARRAISGREEVVLPLALETVPDPVAANSFEVEGLTPIVMPNDQFYRIDTALSVPRVDLSTWTLSIKGMVDRPFQISYADLMDMDMVERYVTLSCVSNNVGGDLVGNAKWLGVPLPGLLDRAGVQTGAEQLVGRSVDDFTVGFPVAAAFDGREALVAVAMNGEPLPFEHGFPARLVVAGLYGYVSATKWLKEIELTTWDAFDAYWIPRGWAKEAPIKTQSRIDTPGPRAQIISGLRTIAGVAWAPNRGISKVEVSIDNGPWQETKLSEPLGTDAWRQWRLDWVAISGRHEIAVRATDGLGQTQTRAETPPAPDGATGWHTVTILVADPAA